MKFGAGKIPWEVFKQKASTHREAVFCSRVRTDTLISCGISNWGGYALLAGVALANGRLEILEKVTPEQEGTVLDYLVRHGPAIDGITCKPDHSVDGIKFDDYMKVIERIKRLLLNRAEPRAHMRPRPFKACWRERYSHCFPYFSRHPALDTRSRTGPSSRQIRIESLARDSCP